MFQIISVNLSLKKLGFQGASDPPSISFVNIFSVCIYIVKYKQTKKFTDFTKKIVDFQNLIKNRTFS